MTSQTQSDQSVRVEPWEIGGALLDILSRGLYSDARDAIREYVQNGVDAEATTIYVTVRGPSVTVRDDGIGMDWDHLRRARRFGVSEKSPRKHVGYRGIGIYSAFGMCEKLSILTRPAGQVGQFRLEFHFGEMRRILEQDRMAEERGDVGLADLLEKHTRFAEEPYTGSQEDHFTMVSLEGLTQEYRAQLHDADSLNSYLLTSIPVAFPDDSYGPKINRWMREYAGLNPVELVLRVGTEDERKVHPQVVASIIASRRQWVTDGDRHRVAFMWHALTERGERIKSQADSSGFLLKIKGFTIGDRLLLKPLWPSTGGRTLYHHFTGEVHVLDAADVYPNAARDDLESSPSKQKLDKVLRDEFRRLNAYADDSRIIVRADRALDPFREALEALEGRVEGGDEDPFELYKKATDIEEELKKHDAGLSRVVGRQSSSPLLPRQRDRAESLLADIRELLKVTRRVIRKASDRSEEGLQGEGSGSAKDRPRRSDRGRHTPPQSAILVKVATHMTAAYGESSDSLLIRAREEVDSARAANSVRRAVEALDELKATGVELTEEVESVRAEMRASLGLAADFPVSLAEALAEEGFIAETERERVLIFSVDSGLLETLGGRGEEYDDALAAIVSRLEDFGESPQG